MLQKPNAISKAFYLFDRELDTTLDQGSEMGRRLNVVKRNALSKHNCSIFWLSDLAIEAQNRRSPLFLFTHSETPEPQDRKTSILNYYVLRGKRQIDKSE